MAWPLPEFFSPSFFLLFARKPSSARAGHCALKVGAQFVLFECAPTSAFEPRSFKLVCPCTVKQIDMYLIYISLSSLSFSNFLYQFCLARQQLKGTETRIFFLSFSFHARSTLGCRIK